MKTQISTGQKAAIQILAAQELGFNINYTDEAKKFLKHEKITPSITIYFLTESDRAADLIIRNNLVSEALIIADKYLTNSETTKI